VKQAFRLAPSRLIVGEMRLEDCLDLVEALNAWAPRLVGENFCTMVCGVDPRCSTVWIRNRVRGELPGR
jgi:hypothetical protein